jgi:hypothetical protein
MWCGMTRSGSTRRELASEPKLRGYVLDDQGTLRRHVAIYVNDRPIGDRGAASEVSPKFISKSDPAAQWAGALKGHAFFAYAANYLIDLDHAVIIDVKASRAIRQAEVGACAP